MVDGQARLKYALGKKCNCQHEAGCGLLDLMRASDSNVSFSNILYCRSGICLLWNICHRKMRRGKKCKEAFVKWGIQHSLMMALFFFPKSDCWGGVIVDLRLFSKNDLLNKVLLKFFFCCFFLIKGDQLQRTRRKKKIYFPCRSKQVVSLQI